MWRASFVMMLLPALAPGQEKKTPAGWREEATSHLKPAQLNLLARQKLVVGDESYRQVFAPYLRGDLPVFVTSDSVLNAWALQAKLSVSYLGDGPKAAGLVEPVPEFYREFGRLCERFRDALSSAGAFADDEQPVGRGA